MSRKTSLLIALLFVSTVLANAQNMSLPQLVKNYIQAQGGEEAVESVKALRLEGVIQVDEKEIPFVQFKKVPNMVRTILEFPNYQLITGYDGQTAWMKIDRWDYSVKMGPKETASTALSAPLFSQVYLLREEPKKLRLLGLTEVDGEPCYEVQAKPVAGQDSIYFISAETFLERKVENISTSETHLTRTEIYFSDERPVPPLTIPFKIETLADGSPENVIIIKKASINPGIYSDYFSPPGELLDEPRMSGTPKTNRKPTPPEAKQEEAGSYLPEVDSFTTE